MKDRNPATVDVLRARPVEMPRKTRPGLTPSSDDSADATASGSLEWGLVIATPNRQRAVACAIMPSDTYASEICPGLSPTETNENPPRSATFAARTRPAGSACDILTPN